MKSIISLSSIVLISFASAVPAMALTQSTERTRTAAEFKTSTPAEPIKVAGLLDVLVNTGVNIVTDEIKRKQQEAAQAAKDAEQAQKAEERRIAQEKKAEAQRIAREKQAEQVRIERAERAERMRVAQERRAAERAARKQAQEDYLNSLSPAEKEEYLAQQKAQQEAQAAAMLSIFGAVLNSGGSGGNSTGCDNQCQHRQTRAAERTAGY